MKTMCPPGYHHEVRTLGTLLELKLIHIYSIVLKLLFGRTLL